MIANYLDMRGRLGPLGFILSFIVLAVLGCAVVKLIYIALHANHHLSGIIVFLGILTGIVCLSILLTQAVKRVNDMGRAGILAIFSVFPAFCVPIFWFYPPAVIFSGPWLVVVILGVIGLGMLMLPGRPGAPADHH